MAVLGLSSFGLGTTTFSGLNLESPESLAEKIHQQQQQQLLETYPNRVVVLIEASAKKGGNLYQRDDAARQGLIYGNITRIIKGKDILYPTASGELEDAALAELVKARIALDLGLEKGGELVNKFHRIPHDKNGSRRGEIEFAFGEEVFINSEATIQTGGICVGDFKAPMGSMIDSKNSFNEKLAIKKADSAAYRKSEREKYQAEREQQLLAQNDIETEAPTEEGVTTVATVSDLADMMNA